MPIMLTFICLFFHGQDFVTMTVAEGDVHRILIKLMNDSPKPNLSNVENRNFQLTLSNAFFCVQSGYDGFCFLN